MKKIGNKQKLQALIESVIMSDQKQPDEFTSQEFYEESVASGKEITMAAARSHLRRLLESGRIVCRKGRMNGSVCNFYSIAK